ncbi:MAG: hypothetical protein FWF59_02680 [Turicibacter sp.]|nr:hypothetical protein [Turicibacter sp.]
MALKFINKKFGREKPAQSMIQPNDTLNIGERSKYAQIMMNKDDLGFKGLKRAYNQKLLVSLVIHEKNGEQTAFKGTISHFDENYEQLVLVVGNSLKRASFSQILEVSFDEELLPEIEV